MRDNNLLMVGWLDTCHCDDLFISLLTTKIQRCFVLYIFFFSIVSLVSYIASILHGSNINYSERSEKEHHREGVLNEKCSVFPSSALALRRLNAAPFDGV